MPQEQSPRERLDHTFRRAARGRRAALVGYLPAGYPTWERSIASARILAQHVDVLEIGLPQATDQDGADIRAACTVARRTCSTPAAVLRLVQELTASVTVPVVVMSYWTPVRDAGDVGQFAGKLAASGAAGLVVPDLPPSSQGARRWLDAAAGHDLATTFVARKGQIISSAVASTGFIYQPAVTGPTGTRTALDLPSIRRRTALLAGYGSAPVCIGIGISSPYQAAAISPYADGVVIGTALVRALTRDGLRGLATHARAFEAAASAVRGDQTDPGRAAA